MYKHILSVLLMLIFAFSVFASAAASTPGQNDPVGSPNSGTGGIVRPQGQPNSSVTPALGPGNLLYHGGAVMITNNVYSIYWVPAGFMVSSGYTSTINQFFRDVAADSGKSTNVYFASTQYQNSGRRFITYKSQFKGTYFDRGDFPTSGCPLYSGLLTCLTDAQIQVEIERVIAVNGWVANSNTEFFMFTPKSVGSCFDSLLSSGCAFTQYCAYHGFVGSLIYANMPYTYTIPRACGVSRSPNHNFAADSTINVTSHEHNESITDFGLDAWYDSAGNEDGDKCAWIFGSLPYGYNQTINQHHYILQEEWSNRSRGCRLTGQ